MRDPEMIIEVAEEKLTADFYDADNRETTMDIIINKLIDIKDIIDLEDVNSSFKIFKEVIEEAKESYINAHVEIKVKELSEQDDFTINYEEEY